MGELLFEFAGCCFDILPSPSVQSLSASDRNDETDSSGHVYSRSLIDEVWFYYVIHIKKRRSNQPPTTSNNQQQGRICLEKGVCGFSTRKMTSHFALFASKFRGDPTLESATNTHSAVSKPGRSWNNNKNSHLFIYKKVFSLRKKDKETCLELYRYLYVPDHSFAHLWQIKYICKDWLVSAVVFAHTHSPSYTKS